MNQFGYFGKTPHRGDFVRFNLPGTYVTVWDDWLQQLMTAGEVKHDSKWPAIYTTAPSYRFALSQGIVGEAAWAGLLIPSVDKVGRRFPFCLVASLQAHETPATLLANPPNWYIKLIALADQVNDPDYDFNELQIELAELADKSEPADEMPVETTVGAYTHDSMRIVADSSTALANKAGCSLLLDSVLNQFSFQYSLWVTHTRTDEGFTFLTNGLPDTMEGISLFNQRWEASTGVFIRGLGNTLHANSDAAGAIASAATERHEPLGDVAGTHENHDVSDTLGKHVAENERRESPLSDQTHIDDSPVPNAEEDVEFATGDWSEFVESNHTSLASKPKPNVEELEIDEDSESAEPWER